MNTPTQTTEQLDLWTSQFGADYTERNDRELSGRQQAWQHMLSTIEPQSILEVGCNVGWNLRYLSRIGDYDLTGIEPQADAVRRARNNVQEFEVLQGTAFALPFANDHFDLAFTSGVLIHIAPADLRRAMSEIYRVSRRYVLYIEYDHPTEIEISYRGNAGALWKRNHKAAWLEAYPAMRVVAEGFWGAQHDYDDCAWCLFEKS